MLLADFVNTTGDAVFDGTLKQALAVQLEQTPFLNLFPEERVREMLQYMGRSPDERVTKEVAREICQRQGIKAVIVGSIANLGRNYAITLESHHRPNRRSNGPVAGRSRRQGAGAAGAGNGGHRVTREAGRVAWFDPEIRRAAGTGHDLIAGSAQSVTPWDLRRNTAREHSLRRFHSTIVRLSWINNFALAYALVWQRRDNNTSQPGLAAEYAEKAFALRDRASEREKLHISAFYYRNVAGELDKALAVTELLCRTYPRHPAAHYLLGNWYRDTGQYEKALEPYREASRLAPNWRLALSKPGVGADPS